MKIETFAGSIDHINDSITKIALHIIEKKHLIMHIAINREVDLEKTARLGPFCPSLPNLVFQSVHALFGSMLMNTHNK